MVVVPDGRVDYDKLLELLADVEGNHLDFKATVDMDEKADQLKLIKDMITMSNRPPGGYILIGVSDRGTPCMPEGSITDRRRYDGARLGDLVRPYIEGQIHIRSQIHDHENKRDCCDMG
ncbi:Putative transcriptional regulator with HTH domain (fragment) [uncultured Mycobacterium sp.]|uniref:Putative transcriptional regulator with HTH domain n=1 Tax=uncultured Mycobacterium sp. TaxID=171292 RepID=A0A1Y5PQZ2_9MYCO